MFSGYIYLVITVSSIIIGFLQSSQFSLQKKTCRWLLAIK